MKVETFQETKDAVLIIGIKVSNFTTENPDHSEELRIVVGEVDPAHDEYYSETARDYLELARVMSAAPRVAASLQKMVGTIRIGSRTKKERAEVDNSPIVKEAITALAQAGYA